MPFKVDLQSIETSPWIQNLKLNQTRKIRVLIGNRDFALPYEILVTIVKNPKIELLREENYSRRRDWWQFYESVWAWGLYS